MGGNELGFAAIADDGKPAEVVAGDDLLIRTDRDTIGADAEVDAPQLPPLPGVPFAKRAIDARGEEAVLVEPGERQHIAGVARQFMEAHAVASEDPDDPIERACRDQPVVGRETRHVDVVAVPGQNRLETQVRQRPDPRRIVAAGADQPSAIVAEVAGVDEMVVIGAGDSLAP